MKKVEKDSSSGSPAQAEEEGKIMKKFDAQLKAKVALEAIKGERTLAEIGSIYEVHPNLVGQWLKQLLEQAAEIFSSKREHDKAESEKLQAELYQQIGQLKVELDWLKKKSRLIKG
jgi:transposase-like protein